MSKRDWSFTKKNTYGPVPSKDQKSLPEFPPFSVSDLNLADMGSLGQIVRDDYGRVFMKVRYAQNTTNAAAGNLAAFVPPTAVTTHGTTACTTAATTSTQNISTTNAFKNWLLGGGGSAASVAGSTIPGIQRRIYSDSGGTNTHTYVTSEFRKEELNPSHYDGNKILNAAATPAEDGFTTGITTLATLRPFADVCLCATAATVTAASLPCGVFLGAVTATTGATAYEDSTYRSTWIQISGYGMVYLANGVNVATANAVLAIAGASAGVAGIVTYAAPPSALQWQQSIGTFLVADSTAANRLVPCYINPGYWKLFTNS